MTISPQNKRRRITLNARQITQLEDLDDDLERQQLREAERRTPDRRASYKPTNVGLIAVGSFMPGQNRTTSLSHKELNQLSEHCMQLYTQNRINIQNSWNLGLIDYLQEVVDNTLSKEQGKNFQKVSCAIDCCVKIYSHRVDSLQSESLKMVSSLNRKGGKKDDEPINEDVPETKKPTRKNASSLLTLETNLDNLNVKNIESMVDLDPLFRVTSAKFDAGGVAGLLLNNTRIGPLGNLMLDSTIQADNEEVKLTNVISKEVDVEDDILIETDITNHEIQQQSTTPSKEAPAPEPISPQLFDENDDDDGNDNDLFENDDMPDLTPPLTSEPPPPPPPQPEQPEQILPNRDSELLDNFDEGEEEEELPRHNNGVDADELVVKEADEQIQNILGTGASDYSFFDSKQVQQPQPPELEDENANIEDDVSVDSEVEAMDVDKITAWSGYWKISANSKGNIKSTKEKKKRETISIDFNADLTEGEVQTLNPPPNDTIAYNTLLKHGKERAKALNGLLPKDKKYESIMRPLIQSVDAKAMLIRAKKKSLCLPEDKHFDITSLFQPFIRPQAEWNLRNRSKITKIQTVKGETIKEQCPIVNDEEIAPREEVEEIEVDFNEINDINKLQQPEDEDEDIGGNDMWGNEGNDDDEDEDKGFVAVPVQQEIVQLVEAPTKVNVMSINYATSATRIDVERLKELMWSKLDVALNNGPVRFSNLVEMVVPDLHQVGKPKEISISFFFITLLRLANDNGLVLKGVEDLSELIIILPSRK